MTDAATRAAEREGRMASARTYSVDIIVTSSGRALDSILVRANGPKEARALARIEYVQRGYASGYTRGYRLGTARIVP